MDQTDYTDFFHTGPGRLAGRYLRRFWHPVYRAQDLAAGRALPIKIMSENFTLYRGEAGVPHVVASRCAHRGTQLSVGWVEGDCIRCFYHGWKYDASGQCVEQPAEDESFAAKVKIQSYPTQEYKGLIFAYFGEGEAPPFPRFLEFDGILEVEPMEMWPCNYWNRLDNAGDSAHVAFVHRESRGRAQVETAANKIIAQETEYGIRTATERSGGVVTVQHMFMPNSTQVPPLPIRLNGVVLEDSPSGGGWMDRHNWRVPVDDENSLGFGITLVHLQGEGARQYEERHRESLAADDDRSTIALGNEVLAGRLRIADIKQKVEMYKLIRIEDYVAQVGQGAMPDYKNYRMGQTDTAVILRRKIFERELGALAEGRQLKQWTHPPQLSEAANLLTREGPAREKSF